MPDRDCPTGHDSWLVATLGRDGTRYTCAWCGWTWVETENEQMARQYLQIVDVQPDLRIDGGNNDDQRLRD